MDTKYTIQQVLKSKNPFKPKRVGFNWLTGYVESQQRDGSKKVDYHYHFMGVKSSQYQTLFRSTES
jgi:hypothetical protein|uniref:Uncharacterized protein n=1 Tax=virus sp. ctPYc18 TaxID=2828251 RepID=A0A8S5RDG6_9VIRU|nr:MAG TPA: hypothetical protein [virus sp. ctPYc18]